MKVCFKCQQEKPLGEFYKHGAMADGHLNKCKQCTKSDVMARYIANPEAVREYEKSRANLPHRIKAREDYAKTPKGKAASSRARKKFVESHPVKRAAHVILGNAVRDKRISKPSVCQNCGNGGRIHGHHNDYAKPLEVLWLCCKCHAQQHKLD